MLTDILLREVLLCIVRKLDRLARHSIDFRTADAAEKTVPKSSLSADPLCLAETKHLCQQIDRVGVSVWKPPMQPFSRTR